MKILLYLKHWQLFALLLFIPMIIKAGLSVAGIPQPIVAAVSAPLLVLTFGIWLFTIGTQLHRKLPEPLRESLTLFYISLFLSLAYIALFLLMAAGLVPGLTLINDPSPLSIFVFLVLHLSAMAGMLYCFAQIAKFIRAIELQRPVVFRDYASEFIMIWFFPIGIWLLQPRINKLFPEGQLYR